MKKFSFLNFKNNKEEDYPPEIKGDYKVNEEDNLLNEEENKITVKKKRVN